jgi:diaminopimelate decarboxylase
MDQKLATELLNTYSSPLYVYDGDRLRDTIRHITEAIPYPRTEFKFAAVTNGNVALLQIVRAAGWGLHANTPGDIYLGLQAGFAPQQIVYSGSNLNRSEMQQVLDWGITTLNLDSVSQLALCCDVYHEGGSDRRERRLNLGLRLNLPEITGDSRIGVQPQEFGQAIAITQAADLRLTGIHFYRGTGTNATTAFTDAIDIVIETAKILPDWAYLDFGGGFGYPYKHQGAAFDWQLFGREIAAQLSTLDRSIRLTIEPGRAAIAGCGTLLTRVVSTKWQGNRQIVGVDTTVANLSVPSVHGGYRKIIPLSSSDTHLFSTDICGNTTYSRDYLGKNCALPALNTDDILAILDVGAYGYAMSSHFLHRPRPAEILLAQDGHREIRQREDYSILLGGMGSTGSGSDFLT